MCMCVCVCVRTHRANHRTRSIVLSLYPLILFPAHSPPPRFPFDRGTYGAGVEILTSPVNDVLLSLIPNEMFIILLGRNVVTGWKEREGGRCRSLRICLAFNSRMMRKTSFPLPCLWHLEKD